MHQQVYNLLAGLLAFFDLPPVGKPKAAINTYRRSINILNLISNFLGKETWLFSLPQVRLFGLVPAGASWHKSQTGDCRFADDYQTIHSHYSGSLKRLLKGKC
jgi:hypothetical protein